MRTRRIFVSLAAALLVMGGMLFASPAVPSDEDISGITRNVYPSVVKVEARNGWRKVATGVVIDKQGHIVTTALITPRDEEVHVTTADGERYEAEFLGMDSVTHLAVIKAREGKWNPIKLGKTGDMATGAWIGVVSISPEETAAVTQGIVSSVGRDTLRLNVWVVPGASGSPVIDRKGRMVGLLRGTYSDDLRLSIATQVIQMGQVVFNREEAPSSGLAVAIPVNIVEKVAGEIKEKGKVERGWMGVTIVKSQSGPVKVVRVDRDSPADEAGFEEGDIILEFDGIEVAGGEMLTHEIRMRRPGDRIDIKIERDEEEQTLKVELDEYSEKNIYNEFQSKFPRLFRVPEGFEPKEFEKVRPELPDEPEIFSWVRGRRQYIGVYLQEINPELAEFFGVKEDGGLLITRLSDDGPAEKAGLRVGDVIVKADGKNVVSQAKLNRIIQSADVGDEIELEIVRDKKNLKIKVEVAGDDDSHRFKS